MKFSTFRFSALVTCMAMPALAFSQTFLPDTVITASRVMQRAQDALPDVSVITRSDIERSQAKDVPSLLQQLAGMEMTQSGGMGGVATLFMRGAESRHALVLVDGLPMKNLNFNLAALEHLPLSGTERIEVVRGNVSSLYGSAALGGVIQIFTRQNSGDGLKGPWIEASGQVGSESFRSAQVSAGQNGHQVLVSTLPLNKCRHVVSTPSILCKDPTPIQIEMVTHANRMPSIYRKNLNLDASV
jgi:outer membrane cobalamin receptor